MCSTPSSLFPVPCSTPVYSIFRPLLFQAALDWAEENLPELIRGLIRKVKPPNLGEWVGMGEPDHEEMEGLVGRLVERNYFENPSKVSLNQGNPW